MPRTNAAGATPSPGEPRTDSRPRTIEGQKPLVLNRTNFEALADAFGDSDEWSGHKINVYAARTQYAGKSMDGLRVEPIVPKPATKDDLNDEIAF
jgi:hypothetical protein